MNKKISVGICLSLMIIASAITFILTSNFTLSTINSTVTNFDEKEEIYNKIIEIDSTLKDNFYGEINQDEVLDALAKGYVTVLNDPYASYNTLEENEQNILNNSGKTVGIGVTSKPDQSGYIYIESVLANSPAEKAGILPGSLIVEVDGESVISLGYTEAVNRILGVTGTNVTLTIREEGVDEEIVLTREEIDIISVKSRLIEEIGYVQITQFNDTTDDQFKIAVDDLMAQGATGLIFDVRNNLGGTLDSTLEILDYLLPTGAIAYSIDKDGNETLLGTSDANEIALPMIILVNSNSASASELFSSALRDYSKAELVGVPTYGKGIMQSTYQLSDGSSITFTTATYRTALSENFDGVGLNPDYTVVMENDSSADIARLDETSDIQLATALQILRGEYTGE